MNNVVCRFLCRSVKSLIVLGTLYCFATIVLAASETVGYRGHTPSLFDLGVERGTSRTICGKLLGQPDVMLGNNLWIFVNVKMVKEGRQLEEGVCVVVIEDDKVVAMKLISAETARLLIANSKLPVVSKGIPDCLKGGAPRNGPTASDGSP